MKLEGNKRQMLRFQDLEPGKVFMADNLCYMKIVQDYYYNNAVELTNGTTCYFQDKTLVSNCSAICKVKVIYED